MSAASFDLTDTYVHIADGPEAIPLEVGDDFWEKIATRTDLGDGRLVGAFRFDADWDSWERHPAGDEIVILLFYHHKNSSMISVGINLSMV